MAHLRPAAQKKGWQQQQQQQMQAQKPRLQLQLFPARQSLQPQQCAPANPFELQRPASHHNAQGFLRNGSVQQALPCRRSAPQRSLLGLMALCVDLGCTGALAPAALRLLWMLRAMTSLSKAASSSSAMEAELG